MRKSKTKTEAYRNRILMIVSLTNIPAIFLLPLMYSQAIGWIAGTIASCGNFWWLSHNVSKLMGRDPNDSRVAGYKMFYLRYLFLIVYSLIAVVVLKLDILAFGAGLVSIQLAIYGNYLYESIKRTDVERENK